MSNSAIKTALAERQEIVAEIARRKQARSTKGGEQTAGSPAPTGRGGELGETPAARVSIPGGRFLSQTLGLARRLAEAWARANILGQYTNRATGWEITVGKNGINKALSRPRHFAQDHLEAIAAVPELLRASKLVESRPDREGDPNLKAVHIFESPLRIGATDYTARLTIKETVDGKRFYDHSLLERGRPAGSSTDDAKGSAPRGPQSGSPGDQTTPGWENVKPGEQTLGSPPALAPGPKSTSEMRSFGSSTRLEDLIGSSDIGVVSLVASIAGNVGKLVFYHWP